MTAFHRKHTFCGICTHFKSFVRSTHKFGILYTLVYRFFTLCSDWTKFLREPVTFRKIFRRNGYPTSFIGKCFKKFLGRLHVIKPTLAAVEKKPLRLVFPYLETISLQVRTKIINAVKGTLN